MVAEKLQGFLGLRATVVVRVQINATRFTQGRLIMHYVPLGQKIVERMAIIDQSIALKTQTPRMEIDAATTTAAVLKMPYVSPMSHFNLHTFEGPIGRFQLCVYSPLVDPSGSGSVAYTVWAHLEDVVLEYPAARYDPTAPDVTVPQMGSLISKDVPICTATTHILLARLGRTRCSLCRARLDRTVPQMDAAFSTIQKVAGAVSKAPGEVELSADPATGVATRVLKSAQNFANSVSSVPFLAPFAKPASWILGIGANIASAFGWSNPLNSANASRMTIQPFSYSVNVNTADQSLPLSLAADNSVAVMPGFAGTDIDELSFAYLSRIPSFIGALTWANTDAVGTTLWHLDLTHGNFNYTRSITDTIGAVTLYDKVPFEYIADHFSYWRSSFVFTLKFIKTEFHSGRVRFSFSPCKVGSSVYTAGPYLYSEILDLRLSNEFTVTVPYVNTIPYLRTKCAVWSNTPNSWSADCMGTVFLQVVNTLENPDTVSSSISVLVEVSAGPDFEVAVPALSYYLPVNAHGNYSMVKDFEDVTVPQMAILGENATEEEKPGRLQEEFNVISTSSIDSGSLAPAKYCIGERMLSLRQILKRSSTWITTSALTNDYSTLWIDPWKVSLMEIQASTAPDQELAYRSGIDLWSTFAPLFLLQRGGMRIRAFSATKTDDNVRWRAFLTRFDVSSLSGFDISNANFSNIYNQGVSTSLQISDINGGLEVNVPQYSQTFSTLVNMGTHYGLGPHYTNCNQLVVKVVGVPQYVNICRQAAEDTNLGFFIGVLPKITYTAWKARTSTTNDMAV